MYSKLLRRSVPHVDVPQSLPNRRLMAAVLRTAVDDYRGTDRSFVTDRRAPTTPRNIRKAVAYVTSTDRTWPFSFENLCEALGLDAVDVRQKLRKALVYNGTIRASQPVRQHEPSASRRAGEPLPAVRWHGERGDSRQGLQ